MLTLIILFVGMVLVLVCPWPWMLWARAHADLHRPEITREPPERAERRKSTAQRRVERYRFWGPACLLLFCIGCALLLLGVELSER